MAANINDKISKVSSGVRPVSTTVSTIRNTGATTLACADLTGWTTTEVVYFVTYKIDGAGMIIPGTQSDWKGIVSGTNINNLTLTGGTDNGNAVGDVVEMLPTAAYAKDLAENVLTHAEQNGNLKSAAVTSALSGTTLPANTVVSSSISNNAVTASKIDSSTFSMVVATGASSYTAGTSVAKYPTIAVTDSAGHLTYDPSTGRITVNTAGRYMVIANMHFATSGLISGAYGKTDLFMNTTYVASSGTKIGSGDNKVTFEWSGFAIKNCVPGDYFITYVNHGDTNTRDLSASSTFTAYKL